VGKIALISAAMPRLFPHFLVIILIPSLAIAWSGKVVKVADGDTITVLHDGRRERIRLYGIDAPEMGQSYGRKAKDALAGMVAGKTVEIKRKDTDRYGRTVGIVMVDSRNVNADMVRAGYAWVYPKYCKERGCRDWFALERTAREARSGMWADPHIVPPWEWRKAQRK